MKHCESGDIVAEVVEHSGFPRIRMMPSPRKKEMTMNHKKSPMWTLGNGIGQQDLETAQIPMAPFNAFPAAIPTTPYRNAAAHIPRGSASLTRQRDFSGGNDRSHLSIQPVLQCLPARDSRRNPKSS